jgi:patatin-related protein
MASLDQSDGTPSAINPANQAPAATNTIGPTRPAVEYTREVRFAVVMYGGVSLAIYINGIAQELLRWARSTAQDSTGKALIPSNASSGNAPTLSSTECVYRKLSYILSNQDRTFTPKEKLDQANTKLADNEPIPTRFIVDILSGTSAGGINGIFLGKGLANGQDIGGLEDLWIKEGDMDTLINDKKSVKGRPLKLQDPPASLLNSERMYLELLKAFDSMEKTGSPMSTPFVDELDLFVTTTDLSGVTLPIRLADGVVYERRHRNVLRFVYSNRDASAEDNDRNDFEGKFNPFLAYAARCTSAFPAAFEPMCLCDTDTILNRYLPYANKENCRSDSKDWQRFYKDYLNPAGVETVRFPKRAFADGGYLDNKPFTYAVETVARRQADLLITRKLIYIEPSPEHPEEQPDAEGKPDAIENVGAALLTLPRYETIREDLQRVREHNRLVERVQSILTNVDADKKDGHLPEKKTFTDDEWSEMILPQVVKEKGIGYVAYFRLDVSSVSDDLAKLVTRVAGFDEESDNFMIIRSLVGAWRANSYDEDGKVMPTVNQFLFEFNLSYPMRRINFLRTKISDLAQVYRNNLSAQTQLIEIKKKLNAEYKNLRRTARHLRSRQVPPKPGSDSTESVPSPAYQAIQNLKKALEVETMKALEVETMNQRPPEMTKRLLDNPGASVVEYFLGVPRPGEIFTRGNNIKDMCDERAQRLYPALKEFFLPIADALKAEIEPAKRKANENCRAALNLTAKGSECKSEPPDRQGDPLEYLAYYYQNYDEYDRIIFPIIYGTEIGEATKVDIIRISPEDATALINERQSDCYKLAGTALGHFGAFLDPLWRRNDIMWGRLDGAERIITALLPEDPQLARLLVGEAQAAIVHEAIAKKGAVEAKDLLCEAGMRPGSRKPNADLISQFIGNLKGYDSAGLLNTLVNEEELRQHYLDTFATRSKLNPESTLKTTSRATTVLGKMLKALSDRRNVDSSMVAWIARVGQLLSGLVEVAVPRSMPSLLFRYWLKLLYLFEVILIVLSTWLGADAKFGWNLLGLTIALNVAVWLLSDFMSRRHVILRTLLAVLGFSVFVVFLIGALKVLGLIGITFGGEPPLAWVNLNLQHLSGWFESKLPGAASKFIRFFGVLLIALLGIFVFWRLGKRPRNPAGTNC